MKKIYCTAIVLLIIGGIQHGLQGLFDFSLLDSIFGHAITRVLQVIVGVAAVIVIFKPKMCKKLS